MTNMISPVEFTDDELAALAAKEAGLIKRFGNQSFGNRLLKDVTMVNNDDEKYRREFRAEPAYAQSMTIDEYVAMRRVDDGIDQLTHGSSAKTDNAGKWLGSGL